MLKKKIFVLFLALFMALSCKANAVDMVYEDIVVENEVNLALPPDADIPTAVWLAAVTWGNRYEIAPEFICAIAYHESRYTSVVSKNGKYYGVMQIHPPSHSDRIARLGVTNLMDISQNINVAADYLHELFVKYEDPAIVLAKYHGEKGDGSQMSSYTKRVLSFSFDLERKNGK